MLRLALVLAFACGSAAGQPGRPVEKTFVDYNADELLRTVPDLAGTKFETSQDGLDALLKTTGGNLTSMLDSLVDLSAAEQIHEMRFETGMAEASRRENFRYLVKPVPQAGKGLFTEQRVVPGTLLPAQPPNGDFLVLGHFLRLLGYLLPQYLEESSFRYVGRSTVLGRDLQVVAFAQHPDSTQLQGYIGLGEGRTALLHGVVWIDAATHRIVRLRADLLGRVEGSPLDTITTDISFVEVNFAHAAADYWLPSTVTVHGRYAGGEVHSVHRYQDYRQSGIGRDQDPEQKGKEQGVLSVTAAAAEDPWELLDQGIALARESKPGEAIVPLREALRLNPEIPDAHFELAVVLNATNDLAGAEAQLRQTLKLVPDSGVARNLLGVVLLNRGDTSGAVIELSAAARLQPDDAIAHYNLAQALETTGDQKAALDEYRTATRLAPDNARFKARYDDFERAANSPAAAAVAPGGTTTIKVDVRQVLVPVVVTDKEGHHATGLTQADFHIFEDGVEQKISAFSVENAGVPSLAIPTAPVVAEAPGSAPPAAATPAKPFPVHRTYMICMDAFHTDFSNLVHIREALSKLFRSEPAGDAQYVLISLGQSMQILQNTTADPAEVLKVIEGKEFQKVLSSNSKNVMGVELRNFQRSLDQARAACDAGEPECPPLKAGLPFQANSIAGQDRNNTLGFVSELRALVDQLRRQPGRRTMILFSDGFQLVPGKMAFELLAAYFPNLQGISLRAVDRMQELEPLLHLLADSNIPVYTIDSRGLYASSFFDASNGAVSLRLAPAVLSIVNQNATDAGLTLSELAAASGGTAFHNSNDILAGLQRAFADAREYYLLAYVPSNSRSDGKFHAISVQVRDKKLVASAKRGYWATSGSN